MDESPSKRDLVLAGIPRAKRQNARGRALSRLVDELLEHDQPHTRAAVTSFMPRMERADIFHFFVREVNAVRFFPAARDR